MGSHPGSQRKVGRILGEVKATILVGDLWLAWTGCMGKNTASFQQEQVPAYLKETKRKAAVDKAFLGPTYIILLGKGWSLWWLLCSRGSQARRLT